MIIIIITRMYLHMCDIILYNKLWLVLTYDLLKDGCIDDDRARFKFDSCVILWTYHNSLLSIATNQFASFV